jgi:hypothetical protein
VYDGDFTGAAMINRKYLSLSIQRVKISLGVWTRDSFIGMHLIRRKESPCLLHEAITLEEMFDPFSFFNMWDG